jgi:hypothetical protein
MKTRQRARKVETNKVTHKFTNCRVLLWAETAAGCRPGAGRRPGWDSVAFKPEFAAAFAFVRVRTIVVVAAAFRVAGFQVAAAAVAAAAPDADADATTDAAFAAARASAWQALP